MNIIELNHYPVKSMRGVAVNAADFSPIGLRHDREWLIAQANGAFITARKLPILLHFHTETHAGSLKMIAPDGDSLSVYSKDYTEIAPVQVWQDAFTAYSGDTAADEWLSAKLGQAVRLFWLGERSTRLLPPDTPLSFADGAPFLLTNAASLADLNAILGEHFEMARFRANVVLDGAAAWAEEQWRRIRIGTAEFELFKPCKRCVLTTIDVHTLEKHPQQQPLAYLAKHRGAVFGMNMRTRQAGVLRVGDSIEIIE